MRTILILTIHSVLLALSYAFSTSFVSRKQYRRPTCTANESCLYMAMGYRFEFCDCPGGKVCPEDASNAIIHQGIAYHFCQKRKLEPCKPGEIATIVNGLQTSIRCVCPPDHELLSTSAEGVVEYTCEKMPFGIV